MTRKLFFTTLFLAMVPNLFGQAAPALLRQSYRAQGVKGLIPSDVTLVGQITDERGTKPFRMFAKGNKVRYENGDTVTAYVDGGGWTQVAGKTQMLPAHAVGARAELIPFLDLISEIDNPRLEIATAQSIAFGGRDISRVTALLRDRTPERREFRRALDEQVNFYLDPATLLVLRSERMIAATNNMDTRFLSTLDFSDYRNVQGYLVPFQIVKTLGTGPTPLGRATIVVTSVQFDRGVDDASFIAPSTGGAQ